MKQALLLIDIQNDYFTDGAMPLVAPELASEKAKQILNHFRKNELLVVHIQHIATRPGSTFFLPGSKGVEIHKNVLPLHSEKIIKKHYPNSFRETGLLDYLKQNEIGHLVICGMMTHMCVDATVRAAKDLGFKISIVADACATKDLGINGKIIKSEDVNYSFLAALNYFYAEEILNAKEYLY